MSVYVFEPRQILVTEGDEVTLEFVGINGASHPTTIQGYGKSFELKRGEVTKVALTADKVGIFPIVCATPPPDHGGRADRLPEAVGPAAAQRLAPAAHLG